MRAAVRWLADHELWILAVLLPGLILPNPLSPWVVAALPALWVCRWLGRGTITRRTSLDGPILFLLLLVSLGVWASPDPLWSLNALYLHLAGVALYSGLVNWIAPAYRGPETLPVGVPGRRIVGAAGLLVAGGAALALVSPLLVPTWGKIGIKGPLLPEAFAILEPFSETYANLGTLRRGSGQT
ncbi:MAG: hypothetical protein KKB13_15225 [Chloroflexi bacterium]|nr:hypothetical protein [Chloroflexota bacterium]